MKTIDEIWALLAPEGEFKRRRWACERLWQSYEPVIKAPTKLQKAIMKAYYERFE